MTVFRRLLTAREASKVLGVSYPTIKKWVLDGKLRTIKTPGGHHLVTFASLRPYLEDVHGAKEDPKSRKGRLRINRPNQLPGRVESIRIEGFRAEVLLTVSEWQVRTIITADSVRDMQLEVGDSATGLIQSTVMMIQH